MGTVPSRIRRNGGASDVGLPLISDDLLAVAGRVARIDPAPVVTVTGAQSLSRDAVARSEDV